MLVVVFAACAGSRAVAQDIPAGTEPTPGVQERPVTPSSRPDAAASPQVRQLTASPSAAKQDPEARGLTFLPEMKPTDGVADIAEQKNGQAQVQSEADAMKTQPMLLDRAVAVIDGEVILSSDVREQQHFAVFEPYSVPGGQFTPMQAMQQIVNRTLLLQQMNDQQLVQPPSDAAVDEQIDDLRKHIPACANQRCDTAEGWQRFLAKQGFTAAELHAHWKSRMQILSFIEVRFRTGIRISKPEIETYYKEKLVPEFQARKVPPPPLAKVSDRIDEVLLQQHVNVLLNDYLRSLKDAGSVLILDPAYSELGRAVAASSGDAQPFNRNGGGL